MDPNHFLMLILLRFELFEQFNGSCSSKDQASNTSIFIQEKNKTPSDVVLVNDMRLNSQDELMQWNRLTEEMLYLLIVIIGTVNHSDLVEY